MQPARGESSEHASPEPSPAKAECGVSRVFVLDKKNRPLMPCLPARARKLLRAGKAVVARRFPFTIRLKERQSGAVQPVRVKIDPGAKTTGLAVVREGGNGQYVLHLSELTHRGWKVQKSMGQRSAYRRRRRSSNLRHRAPRFDNRPKPNGWLPPSLRCRVDNVIAWVGRFRRLSPVSAISVERVKFDTQLMENPDISGAEYQNGSLFGYELKEYVLEKCNRTCQYCGGLSKDPILEIEHVVPRNPKSGTRGSNRLSNLTLGCRTCNLAKGNLLPQEWLECLSKSQSRLDKRRAAGLERILDGKKPSLAPAAAVNATRNALYFSLIATGLPVETGTGGRTKYNRHRLLVHKAHCLDAACTGEVSSLHGWKQPVLLVTAMGRGSYQRTRVDKYGFPRGYLMRQKSVHGFQTGDIVQATVPKGKNTGTYVGRVAVRASGNFNIKVGATTITDVGWKHCRLISKSDGYGYARAALPLPPEGSSPRAEE
ncbi:MAG: HNH endonuclease [Proteobacteria bacterium]|nr:HNH endonuclease [Pseudomonadota bacterium]